MSIKSRSSGALLASGSSTLFSSSFESSPLKVPEAEAVRAVCSFMVLDGVDGGGGGGAAAAAAAAADDDDEDFTRGVKNFDFEFAFFLSSSF